MSDVEVLYHEKTLFSFYKITRYRNDKIIVQVKRFPRRYYRGHLYFICSKDKNEPVLLGDICLEKPIRNLGLGSKIMKFFLDYVEQNGYKTVTGNLVGEREKLIRFYTRFGFTIHTSSDAKETINLNIEKSEEQLNEEIS